MTSCEKPRCIRICPDRNTNRRWWIHRRRCRRRRWRLLNRTWISCTAFAILKRSRGSWRIHPTSRTIPQRWPARIRHVRLGSAINTNNTMINVRVCIYLPVFIRISTLSESVPNLDHAIVSFLRLRRPGRPTSQGTNLLQNLAEIITNYDTNSHIPRWPAQNLSGRWSRFDSHLQQ